MIRVRITFAKTNLIRYIGHLDLFHIWIRIFRRAKLEVAHSNGFHPQPRIQLASALSLGTTGSHELLECWLENDELAIDEIKQRIIPVSHPGIHIVNVEAVESGAKPLQVRIHTSEYQADLPEMDYSSLTGRIENLLAQETILVERKTKMVDIRPFIYQIHLVELQDTRTHALSLRLSAGEAKTGRTDEVLTLLGLDPLDCLVERTAIILD